MSHPDYIRKMNLIACLFPSASKKVKKELFHLANKKIVTWFGPRISVQLNNIMASIVRHRYTDYEQRIKYVGKDAARYYSQTEISLIMDELRK